MKTDLAKAFPSIPVRASLLVEDFYAESVKLLPPTTRRLS